MDLTQRATLAELCDAVLGPTPAGLRASLFIAAEESCFIRFNHAKVRQAQHIGQAWATLTLSDTLRAAQATASLSGDVARDAQALGRLMLRLAQELPGLPEDPHLVLPDEVVDTERESRGAMPSPHRPRAWTSSACMPGARWCACTPTAAASATGTGWKRSAWTGRSTTGPTRR